MANVNIELGYKNLAWFTTNPTLVLLAGQIVYLEQTGTYKIGDGVSTLSVLSFLGISSETQTLQNVTDLGSTTTNAIDTGGITTDYVQLDLTATNTNAVGKLIWNDTDGTLDLGLKGGNVTLQIGQETVARVVNKTGTNITLLESNYQAVRVTGAIGQRPKVDLALANNDLNSATTLGLVTETILNNQEGFINTSGQVREINTTGSLQGETWLDGDLLYLSGTIPGAITNIKPVAPIHTVIIGFVEYVHAIHGKIFVKVNNGYELEELHNVSAIVPNNNEVLTYDLATTLWKPKTVTTALGYTPYDATNPSGYITSSALTGLVPYTGATANVNLGTFTLTTPTINGVSGLLSFKTTDRVSVGNYATPSAQRIFTVGQDTAYITMGSLVGSTSFSAIYMNTTTPALGNYTIRSSSSDTTFNCPSSMYFSRADNIFATFNFGMRSSWNMLANPFGYTPYNFTRNAVTGTTASTALSGWIYTGGSTQWATGNITTQSEIVWGATTYSFVGPSTITNAYGNVFNAPIAGTNCTITNNFAALFNGQVEITNGIRLTGVAPTTPVNGDIWYNGTDLKLKSNGLTKDLTTATTLDTLVFSGSYMPHSLGYTTSNTTAGINGYMISQKISGRKTCTITSLSAYCNTGVAGGNVRLALYSDLNGLPNTLIAGTDTGDISCATTGLKEGTITPYTLVSGTVYHVVIQVSSGTISLRYNSNQEKAYWSPSVSNNVFSILASSTYIAFPATFPTITFYYDNATFNTCIYLKAQ